MLKMIHIGPLIINKLVEYYKKNIIIIERNNRKHLISLVSSLKACYHLYL